METCVNVTLTEGQAVKGRERRETEYQERNFSGEDWFHLFCF